MSTKREKSDYAREWYRNNKGRKDYEYQEHKDDAKIFYPKKERKLQEKITEIWRLTGEFVIPDEKMIKQVEKEILKGELLYEDTIDEVELTEIETEIEDDENNLEEEE
jgi:hypothetical protein